MILDPLYNLRFLLYPDEQNATIDDFILEVESKYRGLGIPTLYGTLSILANKSVLYIAGRGIGKTRVIRSMQKAFKWSRFCRF
ncbi:MAG: hypothetical protein ACW99F_04500 [Candidatus Hodarchaeales archaeon]|jgi:hypothetical protein